MQVARAAAFFSPRPLSPADFPVGSAIFCPALSLYTVPIPTGIRGYVHPLCLPIRARFVFREVRAFLCFLFFSYLEMGRFVRTWIDGALKLCEGFCALDCWMQLFSPDKLNGFVGKTCVETYVSSRFIARQCSFISAAFVETLCICHPKVDQPYFDGAYYWNLPSEKYKQALSSNADTGYMEWPRSRTVKPIVVLQWLSRKIALGK